SNAGQDHSLAAKLPPRCWLGGAHVGNAVAGGWYRGVHAQSIHAQERPSNGVGLLLVPGPWPGRRERVYGEVEFASGRRLGRTYRGGARARVLACARYVG